MGPPLFDSYISIFRKEYSDTYHGVGPLTKLLGDCSSASYSDAPVYFGGDNSFYQIRR